jgi:gas vesicle protein
MAKKAMSTGAKVMVGTGLAALAVAGAAGAYFLYGKDGAKNRKKVKTWAMRAKADVIDKLEKAKIVSEDNYHMIVDGALSKYAKVKDIGPEELAALSKELKSHWKTIKAELSPKVKQAKGAAKKVVAKAKKAVK